MVFFWGLVGEGVKGVVESFMVSGCDGMVYGAKGDVGGGVDSLSVVVVVWEWQW